ncbi:hypothetical protein OG259_14395 [Streptomyces sp. NBC_00250]|uniref:hypothetical protein n=1 Tax=Streptomyces sp. NBC_00250 TaxID=2903641 RepID=UPI002E2C46D2|nr:hypothetical protein [Streptomyces sp. NBC_00250]
MLSATRFAAFARIQVRPALALLVPAAAALTLVLAADPASDGAGVTDGGTTVAAARTTAGDDGFSWG